MIRSNRYFASRPNHPIDSLPYILPSPLPRPPRIVKPPPPAPTTPPRQTLKRRALHDDDDEITEIEPNAKRAKFTNGNTKIRPAETPLSSPSKRRKLEEDGLVLMESATDKLDDDVIEVD